MNFSKLLGATMVAGAGPEPGARRLPTSPSTAGARAARRLGATPGIARDESPARAAMRRRRMPSNDKSAR